MWIKTTLTEPKSRFPVFFAGVLRFSRWRKVDTKAIFSFCSYCSSLKELLYGVNVGSSKTKTSQTTPIQLASPQVEESGTCKPVVISWPHADILLTHLVRNSVLGKLRISPRNNKRAVPLHVVHEHRAKWYSPKFWPGNRFCELSFRYQSPRSEGEQHVGPWTTRHRPLSH